MRVIRVGAAWSTRWRKNRSGMQGSNNYYCKGIPAVGYGVRKSTLQCYSSLEDWTPTPPVKNDELPKPLGRKYIEGNCRYCNCNNTFLEGR